MYLFADVVTFLLQLTDVTEDTQHPIYTNAPIANGARGDVTELYLEETRGMVQTILAEM